MLASKLLKGSYYPDDLTGMKDFILALYDNADESYKLGMHENFTSLYKKVGVIRALDWGEIFRRRFAGWSISEYMANFTEGRGTQYVKDDLKDDNAVYDWIEQHKGAFFGEIDDIQVLKKPNAHRNQRSGGGTVVGFGMEGPAAK